MAVSTYRDALWALMLVCSLCFGCDRERAPSPQEVALEGGPDTSLYKVQVDRLRMRSEPSLSAETITLLPEGVIVKYWGDHSREKIDITLRGQQVSDYWKYTSYGAYTGWVFGGALEKIESEQSSALILPGKSVGPVLATDNEQSIVNRLGPKQVERCEVAIGEGEMLQATCLYAGTERELILLWLEEDFEHLAEVRISKKNSPWQTQHGLKIGSTLKEVESANEKPFMMTGFEWDYAGSTLNWQDGQISDDLALVFEPPDRVHKSLLGDKGISSEDARLRRVNPKVRMIRVLF